MTALSSTIEQNAASIAPDSRQRSAIDAMTICVVGLIASEFMPASLLSRLSLT